MITGLYAAIATLMLIYLSVRVIKLRFSEQLSVGHGGNTDVERAMRVQANFVEYAPLALFLLAISELNGLPSIAIHGFGIAILFSRILHFFGFSAENAPQILRIAGMLMTFSLLLLLAGLVTGQYFGLLTK